MSATSGSTDCAASLRSSGTRIRLAIRITSLRSLDGNAWGMDSSGIPVGLRAISIMEVSHDGDSCDALDRHAVSGATLLADPAGPKGRRGRRDRGGDPGRGQPPTSGRVAARGAGDATLPLASRANHALGSLGL